MKDIVIDRSKYDDANEEKLAYKATAGLNEEIVREISSSKNEPKWMLELRLKSLKKYVETTMPNWGPDLSKLELEKLYYYLRPEAEKNSTSWEDVPEDIKNTFEKLGIPKAERSALAGTGAQFESEVVYHKLKKELAEQGVIFLDMDVALQEKEEIVKKYFGKCVPYTDHKFAMLHYAVWSGGTFIFIPKGVKVTQPMQAYFRMNAERGGQFEHTLIIVEEDAEANYIEGCSAPKYNSSSLHAGCVELFVKKNAKLRYSSVENWSSNTYNLNTKRAIISENGNIEWIGGNLGCLIGETRVATEQEYKKIKDLKKNDTIFSWNKQTNMIEKSKVLRKIASGKKQIFEIKLSGRKIQSSGNHPFLKLIREKNDENHKKGFFKTIWERADKLKEGDIIGIAKKVPHQGKPYQLPKIIYKKTTKSKNQYGSFRMNTKHIITKINWPEKTTKDFMWLLGVIIGDGHIWFDKNEKRAKINIAIPETSDLRIPLKKIVKKIFGYTIKYEKDRFVIINSLPLAKQLKKTGFSGLAHTKKIPKWIHNIPKEQKMAFLAGYFDADGHVGKNSIYYTSVNKELLEQVKLLALSCGIGFSHIFKHGEERETTILGVSCKARASYRILLNGKECKKIPTKSSAYKKTIAKIKTKRNFSTAQKMNFSSKTNEEIGFGSITSISKKGIKETYDIEVEKNHNFIAEGFIVHNSGTTMLYPASILKGDGGKAEHLSIAFATKGQHQDTGAKVHHIGKNTSSTIISKSISKTGGIVTYRGIVKINKGATNAKNNVVCDSLMIGPNTKSNTIPLITVKEKTARVGHEATVGKIGEEQLFYLRSRGLNEEAAIKMIVAGFIEPITKELPLEYAVELNKLIELEMVGSVG